MTTDEPARSGGRPIRLQAWARWLAGALGLAGLGAGTVATFTRDVEAGPVALLAIGGVLLLIALGGWLPRTMRLGESETQWEEAVGEAMADVVQRLPPHAQLELGPILDDLESLAPAAAAPMQRDLAGVRLLLQVVDAIAVHEATLTITWAYDPGFDAQIATHLNDRVVFISLIADTINEQALEKVMSLLGRALSAREGRPTMALLLTTHGATAGARQVLNNNPEIDWYQVYMVEDAKTVSIRLAEMLGLPGLKAGVPGIDY